MDRRLTLRAIQLSLVLFVIVTVAHCLKLIEACYMFSFNFFVLLKLSANVQCHVGQFNKKIM